jgi:hypothetical protein
MRIWSYVHFIEPKVLGGSMNPLFSKSTKQIVWYSSAIILSLWIMGYGV